MQPKSAINHYLASHGLATLADPRALFAQLAMGISSHDKFREVLMKVDPAERGNCYRSLAPRLNFTAKSLEQYEREAKESAERKQLPTYDSSVPGGAMKPFKVAEIHTEPSVTEPVKQQTGGMVCHFCTREQAFEGATTVDALLLAREAGWKYDKVLDHNICPKCAKKRGLIQ